MAQLAWRVLSKAKTAELANMNDGEVARYMYVSRSVSDFVLQYGGNYR